MELIAGGFALTHGAGSNKDAKLLIAVDQAFTEAGWHVHRYNLPFRVERPSGPPHPSKAERDRAGVVAAIQELRSQSRTPILAGGVSYGGRQTSMAASEHPRLADGLVLFSYPLHPPGKPAQLRTAHLPNLQIPVLFVQGSKDPFGSIEEIEAARKLIPARTDLLVVEGAGHDLGRAHSALASRVLERVRTLFG